MVTKLVVLKLSSIPVDPSKATIIHFTKKRKVAMMKKKGLIVL